MDHFEDSKSMIYPDYNKEKDNMYFLFYHMMLDALETDNVFEGLEKFLYLLKVFLESSDIVLLRKGDNGRYNNYVNQSLMNNSIDSIECIVNKTSNLIEHKKWYYLDLNLSGEYKNIMFLYINTNEHDYILTATNINPNKNITEEHKAKFLQTMNVILKRADMHEKNIKRINEDALTGLKSRMSYENDVKEIDNNNSEFIYGLFDLFRLKFVNDNYSHSLGDLYIKEVGKILEKYWPEYEVELLPNGTYKKTKTGHSLYRIGGDEFALITKSEKMELTQIKAKLVSEEVETIKLDNYDELNLGINYGLVNHTLDDTIKDSYVKSDEIMQDSKTQMYLRLGIERRK